MADTYGAGEAPNRNDCSESYESYLQRAADACEAGDLVLGMHLYLAAYEKAVIDPNIPDGMALAGLREAWHLACDLKERSLAEYVFEKLEPYLTGEEISACAQQLQTMALDRLEQYGFSREELEGMAEMISQDFIADGSVVKVESISIPGTTLVGMANVAQESAQREDAETAAGDAPSQEAAAAAAEVIRDALGIDLASDTETPTLEAPDASASAAGDDFADPAGVAEPKPSKPNHVNMSPAPVDDFNPYDWYRDYSVGKSYHCATNEGAGAHVFTRDEERAQAGAAAGEQASEHADEQQAAQTSPAQGAGAQGGEAAKASDGAGEQQPTDEAAAVPAANEVQASGSASQEASRATEADAGAQVAAGTIQQAAPRAVEASGVKKAAVKAEAPARQDVLNYSNLVGYDGAVAAMRDFGIGLQGDSDFINFVQMLNEHHGLDRAPAMDTLLIRSAVLEDAMRFVEATIGEIGLPALRMSMEEGMQGAPMLCVTTHGQSRPRMNHAHNRFEAPAIIVIDDLDTWAMPSMPENVEGMNGFIMANISRGAREAINMIRASVEDPDVIVLATATSDGDPDPFFLDVLEPMTVVDIAYPNDKERMDIWTEIAHEHPSMRSVSRADLMRYSEGLSRFDLYMAAREAIEDAYKIGLVKRSYVPVSRSNIFEKIAACHPLDSELYLELENRIVSDFQNGLSNLEDLLNGTAD